MTVYIAGKMTGLPDKGRAEFEAAEAKLHKLGLVVLNPACLPDGLPGDKYMPMCLTMVNTADALVLLHGWESSPGATLEKAFAEYQGKLVFELADFVEIVEEWHKLLKARYPNMPCQTFPVFIKNAHRRRNNA